MFVFVESVVNFDYTSVAFGFVAEAPQWTAVAVLRLVTGVFTAVATGCL